MQYCIYTTGISFFKKLTFAETQRLLSSLQKQATQETRLPAKCP